MEYVMVGAFVAVFAWAAYRVLYLQLRGIHTTGTITEILCDITGDGIVYHLVVTFTTQAGDLITAKSWLGTEEAGHYFRVGQQVDIMYSSKKPKYFAIKGYDVAGVFSAFLLAALAVAIFCWSAAGK